MVIRVAQLTCLITEGSSSQKCISNLGNRLAVAPAQPWFLEEMDQLPWANCRRCSSEVIRNCLEEQFSYCGRRNGYSSSNTTLTGMTEICPISKKKANVEVCIPSATVPLQPHRAKGQNTHSQEPCLPLHHAAFHQSTLNPVILLSMGARRIISESCDFFLYLRKIPKTYMCVFFPKYNF